MKDSIFLILSIIIFWGLWGFFSKLAVQKIGLQASFWSVLSLILIIIILLSVNNQLLPIKSNFSGISIAILAGIFSGLATILFYILLGKTPAGYLVAMTALYPLVTILLSIIFLKEPLSLQRIIGITLAILGLIFLNF